LEDTVACGISAVREESFEILEDTVACGISAVREESSYRFIYIAYGV
jgi:hypothetical protein